MQMTEPARAADFTHVSYPEPHAGRTRRLLREHPEARSLIGRNPWSALIVVVLVLLQASLAVLLRHSPAWLALVVAWGVGAFIIHALWVLIHEATHNLVFKSTLGNRLVGLLANLPMLVPSAESFRTYHLLHHRYQGDYRFDADLPSRWEARLVGGNLVRKLLWQCFFSVFQTLRVPRISRPHGGSLFNPFIAVNAVVSLAVDAAFVYTLGWMAALYLFASLVFSIGPHPSGARWIQEHYLTWEDNQETGSYYGPLNIVALNVGYHNEHHDLPSVPWQRLPKLRLLAPEMYDSLHSYNSWTRLWLRFLFDPKLTLFSRVTRDGLARPLEQAQKTA